MKSWEVFQLVEVPLGVLVGRSQSSMAILVTTLQCDTYHVQAAQYQKRPQQKSNVYNQVFSLFSLSLSLSLSVFCFGKKTSSLQQRPFRLIVKFETFKDKRAKLTMSLLVILYSIH